MEQYALHLDTDYQILSATYDKFAPSDYPRVSELPYGDITQYKYEDLKYVYDPKPEPEHKPPELIDPSNKDNYAMYPDLKKAIIEGVNNV